MRFTLRSGKSQKDGWGTRSNGGPTHYESMMVIASKALPGVNYAIRRVSFGRRIELSRQIRELARKAEFLEAGTDLHEKIEANILAQEIDAMYLRWGLARVDGLLIDGESASVEQLVARGPDELTREILAAIKEQCGLSEAERKN